MQTILTGKLVGSSQPVGQRTDQLKRFKGFVCLLFALWLLPTTGGAQTGPIPIERAQSLMITAWSDQDFDTAIAASDVILAANPNDYVARALRARVARLRGDLALAEAEAKFAWRVAGTKAQRHEAARMVALTLFDQNAHTRAQLWLRRSVQNAPTQAVRRATIREFNQVRRVNPWSVSLSFSGQQSDNVNGGSREDTVTIFGLPFTLSPDAQALSGTELSYGAQVRRRLQTAGPWRKSLFGAYTARDVYLSAQAKAKAPNLSNADFAQRSATLGFQLTKAAKDHQQVWRVATTHMRYGGATLSNAIKADFQFDKALGRGLVWTNTGAVTRTIRADDFAKSSWRGEIGTGLSRRTEQGTWHARMTYTDTYSASSRIARDGWVTSFGWQAGKPLLGTSWSTEISYGATTFDSGFFGANDQRLDETLRGRVSVTFPNLDLYGFAPSLDVIYSDTKSNVALYSTQQSSILFGIKSAF